MHLALVPFGIIRISRFNHILLNACSYFFNPKGCTYALTCDKSKDVGLFEAQKINLIGNHLCHSLLGLLQKQKI